MRALAALLILVSPLPAHHSFKAEFDPAKQVLLKGTVTKVEWTNPHVWFYIDVREPDGRTTNWAVEAPGPNSLARRGWTRNALRAGDRIAVTAYRARDGAAVASAARVVLSGGTTTVLTQ